MGRRVLGFPLKRVGGRGSYGPAPASASLHRLRRRTVLRGTVRPSSCQHVGSGRNGPRSGGVEGFSRQVIPTTPPKSPPKPGRAVFGSTNTVEGEGSMVLRRTVRGRRPWSEALAEGGPSIPLPSTRKRSRHSRPGPRDPIRGLRRLLETRSGRLRSRRGRRWRCLPYGPPR